jgi:hypothetical protein
MQSPFRSSSPIPQGVVVLQRIEAPRPVFVSIDAEEPHSGLSPRAKRKLAKRYGLSVLSSPDGALVLLAHLEQVAIEHGAPLVPTRPKLKAAPAQEADEPDELEAMGIPRAKGAA